MKWLLPEPNDPVRKDPRLTPDWTASAMRPRAASNAVTISSVTTYSFTALAAPTPTLSVRRRT